jgi:pimeloyl-ACP methyl ester carboxylesterase
MLQHVLFLPGLLGSKLRYRGTRIWDDVDTIRDTLRSQSKAEYLLEEHVTADGLIEDLDLRLFRLRLPRLLPKGFHMSAAVYEPLARLLQDPRRIHFVPFSYNWVQSVRHAADGLNDHLQQLTATGKATQNRWIVIAHSLGSLVLGAYLHRHAATAIGIDLAILCGPPLRGSARAIGAILGIDQELNRFLGPLWKRLLAFRGLGGKERSNLRLILPRMPSLHELLPPQGVNDALDAHSGLIPFSDIPSYLPQGLASNWNYAFSRTNSDRLRKDVDNYTTAIAALAATDRLIVFFSGAFPTPARVRFLRTSFEYADFRDGDITVPYDSALHGIGVRNREHVRAKHDSIPVSPDFLNWLKKKLP